MDWKRMTLNIHCWHIAMGIVTNPTQITHIWHIHFFEVFFVFVSNCSRIYQFLICKYNIIMINHNELDALIICNLVCKMIGFNISCSYLSSMIFVLCTYMLCNVHRNYLISSSVKNPKCLPSPEPLLAWMFLYCIRPVRPRKVQNPAPNGKKSYFFCCINQRKRDSLILAISLVRVLR